MRVIQGPIFARNQILSLGKISLIVGNYSTGKTALCEWLSALSTLESVGRWRSGDPAEYPIRVEISYFDPEPHTAGLSIGHDGSLGYSLDDSDVPLCPLPMKVIYPRSRESWELRHLDDLQFLSILLGVDPAVIQNLAAHIGRCHARSVSNVRFLAEGGRARLLADVEGTAPGLSFAMLSRTEKDRVVMEFAIALCATVGKYDSVLLILDPCFAGLDAAWFQRYTERLSDSEHPFQTIVVVPTRQLDVSKLHWQGWEIIRTRGIPPCVALSQEVR
ncbi:MAG: hypothetical protein V1694_01085 [Candidatus Eisenbacteria bacterium]